MWCLLQFDFGTFKLWHGAAGFCQGGTLSWKARVLAPWLDSSTCTPA